MSAEDQIVLTNEEEKKGFDLTVHHRDKKSGRLSKVTPYVRHVKRINGESNVIYERDGKFFFEGGQEVPLEENFVLNPKTEAPKEVKAAIKK